MIKRFLRASAAILATQVPLMLPGVLDIVPRRYSIFLAPVLMAISKLIRDVRGEDNGEVPWWGKMF